jgi:hypothetical protein
MGEQGRARLPAKAGAGRGAEATIEATADLNSINHSNGVGP